MPRREDNLIPVTMISKEEARKRSSNGGKASVIRRRELKSIRESLEIAMSLPMKKGKVTKMSELKTLSKEDLQSANMTVQDCIVLKLIQRAANGDTKAFEQIRDQIGQKPADKNDINVNGTLNINPFSDLTTDELREALESIKRNKKID